MDFGDILDAWDEQTAKAQASKKKVLTAETAGEADEKEQRINPLTAWVRVHGTWDKDAEAAEADVSAAERRRRLLNKKPDATLDLHGLTRDEAWAAMDGFFRNGRQQGFDKLLIIHGKGNHSEGESIVKRTVRDFIERCSFAGASGHGNAATGGNGATWVLLKQTDRE
jgi:DNA-nicking Smr family endonuclease